MTTTTQTTNDAHYTDGSGVPRMTPDGIRTPKPLTPAERDARLAELGDCRTIRTIAQDGRDITA